MTDDLKNLADHVKARRDAMDWSQLDVYRRGGPSNSTLTTIENAGTPAPSRSTLKKLDIGLGWEPGSAKNTLAGGKPQPVAVLTRTGTASLFVSADDETEDIPAWNTRKPEGMTDEEHKRIVRDTEDYYRWKIQQAAQER